MSRLTVQLVTWNGVQYIPHLFQSLRAQTLRDWDCIVIDNGSTDGTIEAIAHELATFDRPHRFIRNDENSGFAGGHNQAFALSETPFVQLLNQDIVLAPEYLERVLAAMETMPEAGAMQGVLLRWGFHAVTAGTGDGRTDTIDTLGLRVLRNRRVVEWMTGERIPDSRFQIPDSPFEVFGVSGALPMYRRAALTDVALDGEVFDRAFFSYKEDVDLAFRLCMTGWRAFIVRGARAWHDRTAAGPRELSDYATVDSRRTKSALVRYHSYKNHLFVLMKNEHLVN
ncbi:MAG: glycosyltransferase family 2 protein, partial [bacterium]|nr:glycosyltransferase family 2 protein [bacterium]